MQTFTFPSGTTVELPDAMPLCQSPQTVTYDCMRTVLIGTTRAGQPIYSGHSCAAYDRAARVLHYRREVAERQRNLNDARAEGRRTHRLQAWLDSHRSVLDRFLATAVNDPAPCTCPR